MSTENKLNILWVSRRLLTPYMMKTLTNQIGQIKSVYQWEDLQANIIDNENIGEISYIVIDPELPRYITLKIFDQLRAYDVTTYDNNLGKLTCSILCPFCDQDGFIHWERLIGVQFLTVPIE